MPRDKALCMSQYAGKEGKDLMKQTVLKTTVAVLGAGLISYLGTLAVPMLVLLGVMLLDYITGMIKAYIRAELNSKFGIKGILKKLCYMAMVAVGAAVDYLLHGALKQAGIDLHIELFCGLLVTVWLIINELISVLENLAAIGVPGFPRLNRLLSRLKSTVNEKEDEHDT
jgi:toxin secretion/phage lysis holin